MKTKEQKHKPNTGNRVRPELVGKVECLTCGKPVTETCCDWPCPSLTPEEVEIVEEDMKRVNEVSPIQQKAGSLMNDLKTIEIKDANTARMIIAYLKPIVEWYVKTDNRLP
jgi:hypothetical protein